jgi:acyl carrier protein
MSTLNELKQLIHDKFDIDPATLDAATPMAEYGLDSLALAEFLFSVEDHFHVDFPDAQMQVGTLAGLAAVLDELRAAQPRHEDIREAA